MVSVSVKSPGTFYLLVEFVQSNRILLLVLKKKSKSVQLEYPEDTNFYLSPAAVYKGFLQPLNFLQQPYQEVPNYWRQLGLSPYLVSVVANFSHQSPDIQQEFSYFAFFSKITCLIYLLFLTYYYYWGALSGTRFILSLC